MKETILNKESQKELKDLLKKPVSKAIVCCCLAILVIYFSKYLFRAMAGAIDGYKELKKALSNA